MTKLRIILILATICLSSMLSMAQFSRQQADNLVLNQVLSGQLSKVDVYSPADIQTGQNTIMQYDNSVLNLPYPSNWVFFIDDLPFANWNHPCRYVFINTSDGNYAIINSNKYPVDWQNNYSSISLAPRPEPIEMQPNQNAVINGLPPNPHMYAVIINGTDWNRYWRDVSAIYNTLIDVYGFTKENIFVHYASGSASLGSDLDDPNDPSDDIDYDAGKTTIHNTFQELAGETNTMPEIPELGPNDQLFVYVTDHGDVSGGHSYIVLPSGQLFDYELADYVKNIKCAQMIYVMEQCFSGGFVDDLMDFTTYNVSCKNRSVHTAANTQEYSWAELYITNAKYDEFVYYWTAAARGHYPDNNQPWVESYQVGSFPFNNYPLLVGHPGDHNPDLNNDGFVQMEEAFEYADFLDTWSPNGYYLPYPGYSGEAEHPMNDNNIGFTTDLLSIAGYAGIINTNQVTEPRHYVAGGTISINPSNSLTITSNTTLNLGYSAATMDVQPGATLVIQDNVQFLGNYNNNIQINGNIQIGQNVAFTRNGSTGYFDGLYLNNNSLQTSITVANFNNSHFHNYGASLLMNNCTFNDCYIIYSYRGNVMVTNSIFDRTWLYLENQTNDPDLIATVTGCNFSTTYTMAGIDIWNYGKYFIENNTIQGYYNGIQICYSGNGNTGNQSIFENNIYNSTMAGIIAYNTTGSFAGNNIHANKYGVRLMNTCNVALFGNPGAQNYSQAQQIMDNTSYEVYASQFSFPWYFRYNAIIDEDNLGNPSDPLVFHDRPNVPPLLKLDVMYNCWGDNFNPDQDLKTTNGVFKWLPTWCPGGGGAIPDATEDMYLSAVNQFENGNYTEAKNLFQLLIQQHPKSDYAQAAMKELFRLEEYISSDYEGLREYYRTNDSIMTDTFLVKLGDFLANKCNIKIENWPDAIGWYESKILNPESAEDSIFAIIDLGYVYFLMENEGLKTTYEGALKQYKPESKEKYFKYRDYLLSLLPGETISEQFNKDLTNLTYGSLLQNVPNPFTESTQIWYKLDRSANVTISINDLVGKEISHISQGFKNRGTFNVNFINTHLLPGIYLYSLILDGKVSDTKKMSIVR